MAKYSGDGPSHDDRYPSKKESIADQLPSELRLQPAAEARITPAEGLPRARGGRLTAIEPGGGVLYLADGNEVKSYRIDVDSGKSHCRQIWRQSLDGEIRILVAEDDDSAFAVTEEAAAYDSDRAAWTLHRVGPRGCVSLWRQPTPVRAFCVTRRYAVLALDRTPDRAARLVALERKSGQVSYEEPLPRGRVDLNPGEDDAVILSDPADGTIRHLNFDRHCRPPRRPPQSPPSTGVPHQSPPDSREPECVPPPCCCSKPPKRPDTPPPGRPPDSSVPPDDCRPGGSGVPDRCWITYTLGVKVIRVNICDPDQPPCEATLHWEPARISRSARHLVAQSRDGRHLAILDPQNMRVIEERGTGRRPMSIAAARNSNTLLLTDSEGQVFVLNLEPFLPAPLTPAFEILSNERVYHGHSGEEWDPDSVKLGTWDVLILPLRESGQSFSGDIGDWAAWNREPNGALDLVSEYYDEVTYDRLGTAFSVFGVDTAGAYEGPPVSMPQKFRDYYYGPWQPGGYEVISGSSESTIRILFTGQESAQIRAISALDGRPPRDFTLQFPAVNARVRLPESFTLTLDPAGPVRFIQLSGKDREGGLLLIDARPSSLPQLETVDVTRSNLESGAAQAQIAQHLDTMIQATLGPGGTAEGKAIAFETPVVRWLDDGVGLGLLDISIHVAPGPGPDKPQISSVNGLGFDELGFTSSAIAAEFHLPGEMPVAALTEYLNRVLQNGQIDHPEFNHLKSPYLGGARVSASGNADSSGMSVSFDMSIDDGGGGVAKIELLGVSGDDPLNLEGGFTVTGGNIKYSQRNLLRDANEFLDEAYTAAIDAVLGGGPGSESARVDIVNDLFANYKAVVFAFVGPPPAHLAGAWQTSEPDIEGLRGWSRSNVASDKKQRDKEVNQLRINKIGMLLELDTAETLAHEVGHSLGFGDLYKAQGYRNVAAYMSGLDLMAGSSGAWPHFTSYHKLLNGWLDPDHLLILEAPSAGNPVDAQALVVALEHWDPSIEDQVRAAFPGVADNVPVVPTIIAQLAGDGSQFNTLEVRAPGKTFSQSIDPPRVVIANCLDYLDDNRYVDTIDEEPAELSEDFIRPYRRKIHLLDHQALRAEADTYNLAFAPEFPLVGMEVTVEAVADVTVGSQTFPVFHLNVHWEQGDYIDLGFTDTLPAWRTPDLGIDWLGDGQHSWQPGEPLEQGETVIVPPAGADPEPHQIFVRLWNFGTAPAVEVKVDLHLYEPGGGGDADDKNLYATVTLDEVPPSGDDDPTEIRFDWPVPPGQNEHVCFRAVVADSDAQIDDTGAALASADSNGANDWAQQNVFEFEAKASSPPAPVDLMFRIYNDGPFPERVHLIPRGLSDGAHVTVAPPVMTVKGKTTRYFRVKIELDERLLHARCGKDVEFLLEAWREDEHHLFRWGATKYRVKPRQATELELGGYWVSNQIALTGTITPDVGQGKIRLRVHFEGEEAFWAEVPLEGAGTFELKLDGALTEATSLRAYARYEGSPDWSSSTSPIAELNRTAVG